MTDKLDVEAKRGEFLCAIEVGLGQHYPLCDRLKSPRPSQDCFCDQEASLILAENATALLSALAAKDRQYDTLMGELADAALEIETLNALLSKWRAEGERWAEESKGLREKLEIETVAHADSVKAHLHFKSRAAAAEKERDEWKEQSDEQECGHPIACLVHVQGPEDADEVCRWCDELGASEQVAAYEKEQLQSQLAQAEAKTYRIAATMAAQYPGKSAEELRDYFVAMEAASLRQSVPASHEAGEGRP